VSDDRAGTGAEERSRQRVIGGGGARQAERSHRDQAGGKIPGIDDSHGDHSYAARSPMMH
jgi:hypothetical protein